MPTTDPAAPGWFLRALAHPHSSHSVDADGTALHVSMWNAAARDKPPLLFVHGFRATARWWDAIAPFFVDRFRVAAMEFSGMGQSGRRAVYQPEHFTQDIVAVARWLHGQVQGQPLTVVGHSFGGSRLLELCATHHGLVDHAIVLDSRFNLSGDPPPPTQPLGRPTPYPDEAQILARFRLMPPQDALPYVLDHIARHSVQPVPGGWTWRFDPNIPPKLDFGAGEDQLRAVANRVDLVRGEHSVILDTERAARIAALLPTVRGPVVIPDAGHHLMVDQPLALIASLRALLA